MLTQEEHARLNELKAKMKEVGSYVKLPAAEKLEYSALNKKSNEPVGDGEVGNDDPNLRTGGSKVPQAPTGSPEDKVIITRKEFDRLVSMVEDVAKKQSDTDEELGFTASREWQKIQEDKKKYRTAKLLKYRKTTDDPWEYVIDVRHLRYDFNPETRKYNMDIQKLTLINTSKMVDGKPEQRVIEADLQALVRMKDFDLVKILETKKEDFVMVQGQVLRSEVDEDGYVNPNRKTTELVDLKVVRPKTTCTVELPDGTVLKDIPAEKLNNA